MLRRDVVDAAAAGRFHIYAVSTIDEALTLLSGLAAGEPDQEGSYPEGSANFHVAARLLEFSLVRQAYANMTVKIKRVRESRIPPKKEPPKKPRARPAARSQRTKRP
jgi:hypothetical protein